MKGNEGRLGGRGKAPGTWPAVTRFQATGQVDKKAGQIRAGPENRFGRRPSSLDWTFSQMSPEEVGRADCPFWTAYWVILKE